MLVQTLLTIVGLGALPLGQAISGKSYTGWDCCKPGCAWTGNLAWSTNVQGSPKVCDAGNNPIWDGLNAQSGCQSGNGYLCDLYAPTPVTEQLSYGFATMNGAHNCCKCFQLTWRNGAAADKKMIVQAINGFDVTGDLKASDMVILSPGGGHGPNEAGCKKQYGRTWGASNGGVTNRYECDQLPANLQGGCYWRYNWAKGGINTWDIDYNQVACPSRLTSISGCSA